jgi:hypothetical protein
MMRRWLTACVLVIARVAAAQDFGHKVNGTLGLHAGDRAEPGIGVGAQVVDYRANQFKDRNGDTIPVSGELSALAVLIGGEAAVKFGGTCVSVAAAVPVAHVTLSIDRPETNVDLFGLGDVYVQPIQLGWRWQHLDLITGYAFYVPTGATEPGGRGGTGQGQWSHQFDLGGTVFFDATGRIRLSALLSYNLYQRKRSIDFTRGDSIQMQGGAGMKVFGPVEVGIAGFALWQIRDDRGSDVPPLIRGARDRVFGLGPEVDVVIAPANVALSLRYEHDFAVQSHPEGHIFVFAVTWLAWERGG